MNTTSAGRKAATEYRSPRVRNVYENPIRTFLRVCPALLSVRLFANRRAGHTLRKVLIGFSYTFLTLGDLYAVAAFLPALVVFILVFLERGVAAIQSYIFTLLTCLYLKDIYVAH